MQIDDETVQAAVDAFDSVYEAEIRVGEDKFTDNKPAAIRAALTAALATLPAPAGADAVAWCQPNYDGKIHPRKFIVRFEDADVSDAVFDDEAEARAFFEKASINWNCYLFGLLPRDAAPPAAEAVAEPVAYQQREMKRGEWSDWYPSNKEAYDEQQAAPRPEYEVRALYASPPAPAVADGMVAPASLPHGWVSTPEDPTPEMCMAAGDEDDAETIYRLMLAARPAAPANAEGGKA